MAVAGPSKKRIKQMKKENLKRERKEKRRQRKSAFDQQFKNAYETLPIWQLIVGLSLLLLAGMWGLSWLLRSGMFGAIPSQNVTQTALTMTGGIAATSYLVMKYRERVSAEEAEKREKEQLADKKMVEAVELLSSDKPVVQISGVYTLTAIADREGGDYRQRIVDVLCAYIRGNKNSDFAVVESTIMSEIHKRIDLISGGCSENPIKPFSWSSCSFDFHGATFFERVVFDNAHFKTRLNFAGAEFQKGAKFNHVGMDMGLDASEAKFYGRLVVGWVNLRAIPGWGVSLDRAEFLKGVNLQVAEWLQHSFHKTRTLEDQPFYISFDAAVFRITNGSEVPFVQNGAEVETKMVSLCEIAPDDYQPNNTTVPELFKVIPARATLSWGEAGPMFKAIAEG